VEPNILQRRVENAAIAMRRLEAACGDTAVALRDGHIEPGLGATMSEDS
jgi:hypothetical protein